MIEWKSLRHGNVVIFHMLYNKNVHLYTTAWWSMTGNRDQNMLHWFDNSVLLMWIKTQVISLGEMTVIYGRDAVPQVKTL